MLPLRSFDKLIDYYVKNVPGRENKKAESVKDVDKFQLIREFKALLVNEGCSLLYPRLRFSVLYFDGLDLKKKGRFSLCIYKGRIFVTFFKKF